MNSIEAILNAFSTCDITRDEAVAQIDALIHAASQVGLAANIGSNTLGATPAEIARWQEEADDDVRNGFIKAMLHNVPATASSDVVSVFVWDVAQRLMDLRARKVGITKPGDPQLQPAQAPAEAPADPKTDDNQHPGEPVHDDGPY